MDRDSLLENLDNLIDSVQDLSSARALVVYTQAKEFLKTYAGPSSSFYLSLEEASPYNQSGGRFAIEALRSFRYYVAAGLHEGISPERKAQLDVVSDLLEQANDLLDDAKVHPAAPAVLIGATLEEFLRTWMEYEGLSLGARKPGLTNYSTVLRQGEKLDKQDTKDITSWAGTRNSAAHGEWNEVGDRERVRLMLEGVNLFMRKYEGPQLG